MAEAIRDQCDNVDTTRIKTKPPGPRAVHLSAGFRSRRPNRLRRPRQVRGPEHRGGQPQRVTQWPTPGPLHESHDEQVVSSAGTFAYGTGRPHARQGHPAQLSDGPVLREFKRLLARRHFEPRSSLSGQQLRPFLGAPCPRRGTPAWSSIRRTADWVRSASSAISRRERPARHWAATNSNRRRRCSGEGLVVADPRNSATASRTGLDG